MPHTPVLLKEIVEGLAPKEGDYILDCTLDNGGHSAALCRAAGGKASVIGIDLDRDALDRARENLASCGCVLRLYEESFRHLDEVLRRERIPAVNRILFDLGLSTEQLDESGRGFSFRKDEPLLMTFKKEPAESDLTAFDIVNNWDEENLAQILSAYGEERAAKRIARGIVLARKEKTIATTFALVSVIERVVRPAGKRGKIHPATKTFQALRITVNDEIQALREGLEKALAFLAPNGRMAVISFHSLEDRLTKNFFREAAAAGKVRLVTKKPIAPSESEVRGNPRSRSAKLRIVEKNGLSAAGA